MTNARWTNGPKIAKLRRNKGMSQLDLAESAHVCNKTIWRMERSTDSYNPKTVTWIAETLGVDEDELLLPVSNTANFESISNAPARDQAPHYEKQVDFFPKEFSSLFVTKLPRKIGNSPSEQSEKAALYGGRSIFRYPLLRTVVSDFTFPRKNASDITSLILASSTKAVRSYTLKSSPGAGLSIALGQVVHALSSNPSIRLFWLIDTPEDTDSALQQLSSQMADSLFSELGRDANSKHAVIVIDDVSEAGTSARNRLNEFRLDCENLGETADRLRVTFLFGWFGDTPTCSVDGSFELTLTPEDQTACFETMAKGTPQIIQPSHSQFAEFLLANPESRAYVNDAQAFIDFLLQYGSPTKDGRACWLADTNIPEKELHVLTVTAVSELIGLAVEERVAVQLFAADSGVRDAASIAKTSHALIPVHDDWEGLGLSCSRRAKSILVRSERFTREWMQAALDLLLETAIKNYRNHAHPPSLDYARHILQRLGKRPYYNFPNKISIGYQLSRKYISELLQLSSSLTPEQKAVWAGTLAILVPSQSGQTTNESDLDAKYLDFVCCLCEEAVDELSEAVMSDKVAVGLLSGFRRVMTAIGRCDVELRTQVQKLEKMTNSLAISRMIAKAKTSDPNDFSYRVNELILVRSQFVDQLSALGYQRTSRKELIENMGNWFDHLEEQLKRDKIELDAGCLLQRSKYIWFGSTRDSKQAAVVEKANFLRRARRCVLSFPQTQGTWAKHVDREVRKFLKANGSCEAFILADDKES